MGFYGNITNMSKTQFTFDKVYANRYEMDRKAASDSVFIGRYVLVEYDKEYSTDTFYAAYRNKDLKFFSTPTQSSQYQLKVGDQLSENTSLKRGTIIRVPAGQDNQRTYYNIDEPGTNADELWKCNNDENDAAGTIATFELVSKNESLNYARNYATDMSIYQVSRGYDSTVWQKTLMTTDGGSTVEKYVMIAELNSVVPSFTVTPDAPTQGPIEPHFGTNSTNVYYDLHWQPTWGFRLKSAEYNLKSPILDGSGNIASRATDAKEYPSDLSSQWTRQNYDSSTGAVDTMYFQYPTNLNVDGERIGSWTKDVTEAEKTPVAVYFNKKGFDPDIITYSADKEYRYGQEEKWTVTDEINITGTGQSGYKYSKHDGTLTTSVQPDIQELSIMLPSLGDTIAKIWDIVYGNKELNTKYTEKFHPDQKDITYRNQHISWQSANQDQNKTGHRLLTKEANGFYTYDNKKVNTLAGAINSAHDLMGMIISGGTDENGAQTIGWEQDSDKLQAQIDVLNDDYIYYKDNKFYRKHKTYDYAEIQENELAKVQNYVALDENVLKDWDSDTNKGNYYYIDSDRTETPGFIKDSKYHPDRQYVTNLKMTPKNLSFSFKKNTFYTKEELTVAGTWSTSEKYAKYKLSGDSEFQGNTTYYTVEPENLSYRKVTFYENNYFYTKNADGTYSGPVSEDYNKNLTYYRKKGDNYELIENMRSPNSYKAGLYYTKSEDEHYQLIKDFKTTSPSSDYYEQWILYYPGLYYYAEYKLEGTIEDIDVFSKGEFYTSDGGSTTEDIKDEKGTIIVAYGEDTMQRATSHSPTTPYYSKNYVLDNNKEPSHSQASYYYIPQVSSGSSSAGYVESVVYIEMKDLKAEDYVPGVYYQQSGQTFILDQDGFDEGVTYYKKEVSYTQTTQDKIVNVNEAKPIQLMTLADTSVSYFYKGYENDAITYTQVTSSNSSNIKFDGIYYNLKVSELGTPYTKNNYYYKVEDENSDYKGSYLLSTGEFDDSQTYYQLASKNKYILINQLYYAPNLYYYKQGEEYILATNSKYGYDNYGTVLKDKTYYTKSGVYVISDDSHILSKGAEWNLEVNKIPKGIVLGTRTERWELEELPGLGQHMNTMLGQLLTIHKMLEQGDMLTRDRTTVQGTINSLNDIIAKFASLKSGDFTIVDDHGRIHSATFTTDQGYSYSNWQKAIPDSAIETDNPYLIMDVNSNAAAPSIHLAHNIHTAPDTTTVSDKNAALANKGSATALGNNNSANDSLILETPIVDSAGHIVGKNTETVTLPYSIKYIDTATSDSVSAVINKVQQLAATKTKDKIAIGTGNKWINLNANNKQITLGHALSALAAGEHSNNNTATQFNYGDSFNLPVYTTDEAGHITGFKTEALTLPNISLVEEEYAWGSGNLICDIALNEKTGELSITRGILGDQFLAEYLESSADNKGELWLNNDLTLYQGLRAIENAINDTSEVMSESFANLAYSDQLFNSTLLLDTDTDEQNKIYDDSYVYAVQQTDGQIELKKSSLLHTRLKLSEIDNGEKSTSYTSIYNIWASLNDLVNNLDSTVSNSTLGGSVNELSSSLIEVTKRVTTNETNIESNTTSLAALDATVQSHDTSITEMQATIETLTQQLTTLQTNYDDLLARVEDLELKADRPAG